MTTIKEGARVCLNSGGPSMTVAAMTSTAARGQGSPQAVCMWFDAEQRMQTCTIPVACLVVS